MIGVNSHRVFLDRSPKLSLAGWALAIGFLFTGLVPLPAAAQLEPCGFYEFDGVPGYGSADLWFTAQFWQEEGSQPSLPDFNGDNRVDVLDMIQQTNCVRNLNHGLLGSYYGFEDGSENQQISFPDFNNLPGNPDPAVMRVAEMLEVLDGYRGFMDSEMRRQFGAVYDGYLFVPETANYTLHIFGNRGMRLRLDGQQILEFDGWPQEDSVTLPLDYGLHPIRIEFYVNTNSGRILLDWSSDGTVVGSQSQTVQPGFLYHESTPVPDYTVTDLELLINPPSGSRSAVANSQILAYATGPNADIQLFRDNAELVLTDGFYQGNLSLSSGLNTLLFRVTDADGRVKNFPYHIYYDNETLTTNGLAATLYATEWYDGTQPSPENLSAYTTQVHVGSQLYENNGYTPVGSRFASGGSIVNLEGTILISSADTYEFRITNGGALYINGEMISGIGAAYADQWQPNGEVYLEPGRHHYRLITSEPWSGPAMNVLWTFGGGLEDTVPDSVFRHGPSHFEPSFNLALRSTGGRVGGNQVAEYLFQPGQLFEDTSGNGFHLWPDPRAIPRAGGGISYQSGGALTSEQAGVHLSNRVTLSRTLTLEADIIYEHPTDDWNSREVVSLSEANWGRLARIYIQNDHLIFRLYDESGSSESININNAVTPNTRMHIVGTYDGATMRLYVNGALIGSLAYNPQFDRWPSLAHFNVGQGYAKRQDPSTYDQQMIGTFLAAACYSTALSQAEIQTNMQANLTLNPTPGPLPAPVVEAYPLAGTTPAELDEAFHLLNRLSFGPSPDAVNELLSMGATNWINQQMSPQGIDDSELDALLAAGFLNPLHYERDFQGHTLLRMILSKRQFLEVMTQFWENHFNTQLEKVYDLSEEMAENERFRALAFGDFEDLLTASAMHYPMTVYLDNDSNVVGAPNENYGREILELHTMGVNNGYTQQDIVEAARCFTGWTVRNGKFFFNPGLHDYGAKSLLGMNIPAGGGLSDGIAVIQHLVQRTETADFITWKLCQLLIDDDPPADVMAAASATFNATSGDVSQTLQTILNHARFRTDLAYRGNKTKNPLEFVASMVRLTETYPMATNMIDYLLRMGMNLFNYPEPTGFAEEGVAWIDTNSVLERWNFINDLTTNRGAGYATGMNLQNFVEKRGVSLYGEILDLFEDMTTHGAEAPGARAITEAWLTGGNPGSFVLDADTLDNEVRQTLGLYLRLPELNRQ